MAARTVRGMAVGQTEDLVDFEGLYRELWWPFLRLATGLIGHAAAAEDIVQDAFAATYRRWDTIRDHQAAAAYLRAAVVNGSRSAVRRQVTARKHLRAATEETDEAADHTAMRDSEHDSVRAALLALPDRQREVLTLRFVAELSDAEIAAATGLSEGGVRSASSRGLAALRNALGDQL